MVGVHTTRSGATTRAHLPGRVSDVRSVPGRVGSLEWTRLSTDWLFFSWGSWVMVALVAGFFFPGPATADRLEAPPAAPHAVLLHLDTEVGDDAATGQSWDEPLRSLEEVQRRLDEGLPVSGLRLAAGWYPGALHTTRSLRVEGGFPPAGLPREGAGRIRGEPAVHRTVIDALGHAAVLRIEGASLSVDGVVLTGGWSLEGGAISASDARVTVTRSELVDSGPALIGCRDCSRIDITETKLARASTAGVELFGETRTSVRLRRSEFSDQRRAVVAESPVEVELSDCRLSELQREALSLPVGSHAELTRVEGLNDEPEPETPSPAPAHRLADR